ncbi:MAG: hypothetical protein ACLFPE_13990 [Bacteroidales bacterium]
MKKNVWGTIVLVAILAVVAVVLVTENRKGTLSDDISEFAIDDTASVTKIFMADMRGNEVLLEKVGPGKWTLNDTLGARIEGVELLLKTMQGLEIHSPVSKSSYNNVITRLATNSTKVEIYQVVPRINIFGSELFPREKLTKTYFVGHATPDNLGTFMLMEGAEVPFVVDLPGFRGFVAARFSPQYLDWRDHAVFRVPPEQLRSITLEFPGNPEESFRIEKTGSNQVKLIQLQSGKAIEGYDAGRLVEFVNTYKDIRFEAVLDKIDIVLRDSIVDSQPTHIITVTDTSGVSKTVKTFRRPNTAGQYDLEGNLLPWDTNRLYALLPENNELVMIQYFVFDPATRPLSYIMGRNEMYSNQ